MNKQDTKNKIEKILKKINKCSVGKKMQFDELAKLATELREIKEEADYNEKTKMFWEICEQELKEDWNQALEKIWIIIMDYMDLEKLLYARREYRDRNKEWGLGKQ